MSDNFFDGGPSSRSRHYHNKIKRAKRLAAAREKGRHTREEWDELVREFAGLCVRCGEDGLRLQRDHIRPIYQGGSDGIDNIQPLCQRCNCAKGPEDFDWKEHRRAFGWGASE